jgi:hypothetical protein
MYLLSSSHQQAFRHFIIKYNSIERRINTALITESNRSFCAEVGRTVQQHRTCDAAQEKVKCGD